jgi:hypothetical protein
MSSALGTLHVVSAATALGLAVVMAGVAAYKGRTAWHWLVLTIIAFATIWVMSVAGLAIAGVSISLASADVMLAAFAGAVSGVTLLFILAFVPVRPRRRSGGTMPLRVSRGGPGKL